MRPLLEEDLRSLFRKGDRFPPGSAFLVEPGRGSDTGIPDVWVIAEFHYRPLELKRGINPLKELRPNQIRWHKLALLRGVRTYLASIVEPELALFYELAINSSKLVLTREKKWDLSDKAREKLNDHNLSKWLLRRG